MDKETSGSVIEKIVEIEENISNLKIFTKRHKSPKVFRLAYIPVSDEENTSIKEDVFSVSSNSMSNSESPSLLTPTRMLTPTRTPHKKKAALEKSPTYELRCCHMEYQIDSNSVKIGFKNVFDSHCHLDRIFKMKRGISRELSSWLDTRKPPPCRALETLEKESLFDHKLQSKFEGCITVCCDPIAWNDDWYTWFTQERNIWITYGCHPAKANFYDEWSEYQLLRLLKYPRVVALGEIGLDETYYTRKEGPSLKAQQNVFKRQIKIAIDLNKAICIHLRAAENEGKVWQLAKEMLIESGLPREWKIHMHCFNHTLENALEWLNEFPNMKFGLVPNNFKEEIGRNLDLQHILLETDAPYFIPSSPERQNKRKQFSVPANIIHVAVQIASMRSIPVDQVLKVNRNNIEYIYGISPKWRRKKRMSVCKEQATKITKVKLATSTKATKIELPSADS